MRSECNLELNLWHDQLPLRSLSSGCFSLSVYEILIYFEMRMLYTSRYIFIHIHACPLIGFAAVDLMGFWAGGDSFT